MFNVLGGYLDLSTSKIISTLLEKFGAEAHFFSVHSQEEEIDPLFNCDIHLCLVSMDSNPEGAFSLLNTIHDSQRNRLAPVFLFSKDKTQLAEGFFFIGCCRYFFLPLTERDYAILSELFDFTYKQYSALFLTQNNQQQHLILESSNASYKIPFPKILFVESIQHKCFIHTTEKVITVSLPLYKIKERCPENLLVQCHRSYLVNPNRIHFIDKTPEPWIVYFKNYPQRACISRSYRKYFSKTHQTIIE